jgi:6-phosphofructokinase 1
VLIRYAKKYTRYIAGQLFFATIWVFSQLFIPRLMVDIVDSGIRRGYHGLYKGEVVELNARSVSGKLSQGGTFLNTARSEHFMTEEGLEQAAKMTKVFDLDGVVACGGDGTMKGATALARVGVPVIFIPATIDNDVGCTDYTIGFDTALNTAIVAVDKLKDTASSHERCSVIEVMGRETGYLALHVGIATGAEIILIPEHPVDRERDVLGKILTARNRGKHHYIVIVAEGAVESSIEVANYIEDKTQIEARATVLGYFQRGGAPTYFDRYIASMMGIKAVECLISGRQNRAIVYRNGQVLDDDLFECLNMTKKIDEVDFQQAKILSI